MSPPQSPKHWAPAACLPSWPSVPSHPACPPRLSCSMLLPLQESLPVPTALPDRGTFDSQLF